MITTPQPRVRHRATETYNGYTIQVEDDWEDDNQWVYVSIMRGEEKIGYRHSPYDDCPVENAKRFIDAMNGADNE